MKGETAAVLSPEHSPRLRHAAAAQPPSNDNASQASYSPKQQPLLCTLCARLMKAAMWHCTLLSTSQGCGMLMLIDAGCHDEGNGVARINFNPYVTAGHVARQPGPPCESAWGAMPTIQRTLAARSSGRVAGCGPDATAQHTLGGACCRSHAPAGGWITRDVQKWDFIAVWMPQQVSVQCT